MNGIPDLISYNPKKFRMFSEVFDTQYTRCSWGDSAGGGESTDDHLGHEKLIRVMGQQYGTANR